MRRLGSSLVLSALLAAVLLPAGSASALSYPVTSTADSGNEGTLRWAIGKANAQSGPDLIPIEVTGKIFLADPLPAIEDDLAIVGPGPGSLALGRSPLAVSFVILAISGGDVSLEGIEITEGENALGGGIHNKAGGLTLTKVAVVGNKARSENMLDLPAHGGGIYSQGPLTLRESVVSDNRVVTKGSAETDAEGGGIFALGNMTVDRSTISGNTVDTTGASGSVSAHGGGIFAAGGGLVTGATVAGNSALGADSGGSNLYVPVDLTIRDTIVAEPRGGAGSCSGGGVVSGGYNLDEDDSCGLGEGSDLVGVAGLDPELKDNGGPTPTHALLPGSLAIDRGSDFGATTDQRGLPRPSDWAAISNKEGGDGSDIGAFELQAPAPGPGGGPAVVSERPTDQTPPNTRIVSGPPRVTYKTEAKLRFASSEAQSHFQCKLDRKKGWAACANPFKRSVKPGRHLFRVRAIDRFGNVDPTPARFGWRVKPISG